MDYLTAAAVGLGIGVIAAWIAANIVHSIRRMRHIPPPNEVPDIEREFRNVFAMMTADRRQSLIRYHMEKYECGRDAAMRIAIDDRERDIQRWG